MGSWRRNMVRTMKFVLKHYDSERLFFDLQSEGLDGFVYVDPVFMTAHQPSAGVGRGVFAVAHERKDRRRDRPHGKRRRPDRLFRSQHPEERDPHPWQAQPLRAVFRDSSFASSPQKINAEGIFKLLSPSTTIKVI